MNAVFNQPFTEVDHTKSPRRKEKHNAKARSREDAKKIILKNYWVVIFTRGLTGDMSGPGSKNGVSGINDVMTDPVFSP